MAGLPIHDKGAASNISCLGVLVEQWTTPAIHHRWEFAIHSLSLSQINQPPAPLYHDLQCSDSCIRMAPVIAVVVLIRGGFSWVDGHGGHWKNGFGCPATRF